MCLFTDVLGSQPCAFALVVDDKSLRKYESGLPAVKLAGHPRPRMQNVSETSAQGNEVKEW